MAGSGASRSAASHFSEITILVPTIAHPTMRLPSVLAVESPWQPADCFKRMPTASVGGRPVLMSDLQPFEAPSL